MSIERYTNDASDFLNTSINNSVTSLDITDGSEFPTAGLFSIKISSELMKVTAVTPGAPPLITLTVVRGTEGTTAASHTAGDPVRHVITARSEDQFFLDQISVGAYASLPSENKAGRLYVPTDGYGIFYNNGGGYLNYSPLHGVQLFSPQAQSWSWVNQNSSTIANRGSGLTLKVPSQVSANITLRDKALAFASNYTATACFIPSMQLTPTSEFGLYLNDGTGLVGCTCYANDAADDHYPTVAAVHYTNVTTFSAFAGSRWQVWPGSPLWLRLVDDGTSRIHQYSLNGVDFFVFRTDLRTAFITPTRIGWGLDPAGQTNDSWLTLISWNETNP